MKLVFCTTDGAHAFNGINAWLVRFLPALQAAGNRIHVILFTWSPPDCCTTLPLLKAAGVPASIIDRPRNTESAVRDCLSHVRSFFPDVFVPNHVLPALYASRWIRASGIPTVGIWHNDDDEYRAKNTVFARGDNASQVSGVITISKGLGINGTTPSANVVTRCISYGVPDAHETCHWDGKAPLRLVYHGRIVQHQKRILETTEALVRVARANGTLADIYGSGPEREAVKALLSRDSANGRVRLCGALSPAEVMQTLPNYHVAVLLSDFEGLGLSILEAMSCGLVPVCHRTASGLPDIIAHGSNGLFVDNRSSSFDQAITRLATSTFEWRRLSNEARATVRTKFSQSACLEAWMDFLSNLSVTGRRQTISIPSRIELPPPHPALASEDKRYPGLLRDLWRRIRFPKK